MATKRWTGKSIAVSQVEDGAILTFDAATTYKLTIGGIVVSVLGNTNVNTTAADLITAAAASTHPYFTAITWTNPAAPSATITATATTTGVPFTATLTATGGTGTVTAFSVTTASTGPQHWDDANNWDTGTLPGAADDVIIEDSTSEILYGIDVITAGLDSIKIFQSFSGKIGLDSLRFSTGLNSSNANAVEYREDYLKIDVDDIQIGQQIGPGNPAGSPRIKIDNINAAASLMTVFNTGSGSSESNLPAVRYKSNHANADVTLLSAPAGVGIGKDFDGETSLNGDITVRASSSADRLFIGQGVTYTNYTQFDGNCIIDSAATLTLVKATGGELEIFGDFTITTLTNDGSTVTDNHIKTGGDAVTTMNNTTGSMDLNQSNNARTIGTLNQGREATLLIDPNVVTVTTFVKPSDPYQLDTQRI